MKSKLNGLVAVLILVLVFGACNTPSTTTPATPSPPTSSAVTTRAMQEEATVTSADSTPAYPGAVTAPTVVDRGSYPAPETIERVHPRTQYADGPLVVPAAKAETGVVHGRLVADEATELVLFTGDIYLAPVVYMEGEVRVPFLSLDEMADPKASLRNSDNEFVVVDVKPGEYGVIIHTPVSDLVVPDAEFGFLIITVVAGQVIDLGDLTVE